MGKLSVESMDNLLVDWLDHLMVGDWASLLVASLVVRLVVYLVGSMVPNWDVLMAVHSVVMWVCMRVDLLVEWRVGWWAVM